MLCQLFLFAGFYLTELSISMTTLSLNECLCGLFLLLFIMVILLLPPNLKLNLLANWMICLVCVAYSKHLRAVLQFSFILPPSPPVLHISLRESTWSKEKWQPQKYRMEFRCALIWYPSTRFSLLRMKGLGNTNTEKSLLSRRPKICIVISLVFL